MSNANPPDKDETSKRKINSRALFALKVTVSASLLAYLFSLVDLSKLAGSVSKLRPEYIGAAAFLLLFQSIFSTFKWKTLLAADDIRLPFLYLLKTYLISNFVSLFLPTSFGGDVYRVMAVRGAAMSTAKTTSSVLFDRLTGLFALLSIATIAYVVLSDFPYKSVVAIAYLSGVFLFWLGSSGWIIGRLDHVENTLIKKVLKIFRSFYVYGKNHRCLVIALTLSLAFQFNTVIINKMYTLSLGLAVPFETLLLIIPLVYLTEAIPFSINGLGFREGAFVFFFQLIGQSVESGLAMSLLVLTMRYSMGLIGGTLLLITVVKQRSQSD